MERSRVTQYLRIAVTALSLTACVLLIALWVRSYWWMEMGATRSIRFHSLKGAFGLMLYAQSRPQRWWIQSVSHEVVRREGIVVSGTRGFGFQQTNKYTWIQVPYWLLVLAASFSAAVPWFKWKFSLRTLLIATTLVAVGLSAIVYASR